MKYRLFFLAMSVIFAFGSNLKAQGQYEIDYAIADLPGTNTSAWTPWLGYTYIYAGDQSDGADVVAEANVRVTNLSPQPRILGVQIKVYKWDPAKTRQVIDPATGAVVIILGGWSDDPVGKTLPVTRTMDGGGAVGGLGVAGATTHLLAGPKSMNLSEGNYKAELLIRSWKVDPNAAGGRGDAVQLIRTTHPFSVNDVDANNGNESIPVGQN